MTDTVPARWFSVISLCATHWGAAAIAELTLLPCPSAAAQLASTRHPTQVPQLFDSRDTREHPRSRY